MGLEMGLIGLVALPREQCHSTNRDCETGNQIWCIPRDQFPEVLLELQSLGIPNQWGSQNEPQLYNPDVKYWTKQLLIGQVAFGEDLNGGGGDRQRGLAGFCFHCRLHMFPLWSAVVAQESILGGCTWPPQGKAPARNMRTRRGVELLPWASCGSAARMSWLRVKCG